MAKNGGTAWPTLDRGDGVADPGMSLRDWFAGQALVGFLSSPAVALSEDQVAKLAYIAADAMLREGGYAPKL